MPDILLPDPAGGDHAHSGAYAPAEIAGGTIVHTVPYPVQWINGALQTADTTLYMRCLSRGTINAIRLWIGTSSGNISVAVYRGDGTNGAPGTRVATSGAIASPGTAMRDVALGSSVTVEVGDWLSLSADNVTVTFAITTTSGATSLFEGLAYRDLVHPAPATATPSVTGIRTPILTGVNV